MHGRSGKTVGTLGGTVTLKDVQTGSLSTMISTVAGSDVPLTASVTV